MGTQDTAATIVAEHFPLDGPYTPEQVQDAARTAAELVRYLNRATQTETALPYANTVHTVVGELIGVTSRMEQTCRQLADRIESMSINDPDLYATDGEAALDRANRAVSTLEGAEQTALRLSAALGATHDHLGYLGNRITDEDEQ